METSIDIMERFAKVLTGRGLQERERHFTDSRRFSSPPHIKSVYLGTYLNPFSVNDECGKRLWTDNVVDTGAEITVQEVYRHNGTSENKSVEICIRELKASVYELKVDDKLIPYIEEELDGDAYKTEISGSTVGYIKRIAKLPFDASDKRIENAVSKAIEELEKYAPQDLSEWEKKAVRWHSDTEEEYRKAHMGKEVA